MKTLSRQLFLGAAIAFCFAFTFVALAEDAPPASAPVVEPKSEAKPENPAAPAAEPAPATATAATAATEPAAPAAAAVVPSAKPAEPAASTAPEQPAVEKAPVAPKAGKKIRTSSSHGIVINPGRHGGDQVRVMGDNVVDEGTVVSGKVVTVMGDTTIDGTVQRDVVSVMGDITINGTVHGKVASVMGDVTLGPKARVDGDVITKMGDLVRDEGAVIGGKIIQLGDNEKLDVNLVPFSNFWDHGLSLGRLHAFGPGMGWVWVLSAFTLALYMLLALLFPGGIRKCGDVLVQRPALTVVTSILAILALPVLFVLLCVTIIGIPVALLFLPLGVVLAVLFGRAAIYALVGRALSRDRLHPALAVFTGGLAFLLFYLVPFAGLVLSLLVAWLGFGCVITALVNNGKKPAAPAAPMAPVVPARSAPSASQAAGMVAPPMTSMGFGATTAADTSASPASVAPAIGDTPPAPTAAPEPVAPPMPPPPVPMPPMVSTAMMPRAGFWIRAGALFIDGIIVAMCFGPWAGPAVLPILALYAALLWKFRGTTIGGIVCGLQVVRLDGRPLDWPTVVFRALGCFLSLVVIGLGFVWVAFDDEKQSWHDKIAGTTVVRPPKRLSLV